MSAEAREAIATAASSVDGLSVSPYFRQVTKPGFGFVRLVNRTRAANRFGWIDSYEVWIALQQDIKAAEAWIDARCAEVCTALAPELPITTVTPSDLVIDAANSVPGVIFQGTRAETQ